MQGKRSERHKDGDVQKETGTRRRHWSLRNLFQCIFDDTESSENDRQWPVRDVQVLGMLKSIDLLILAVAID